MLVAERHDQMLALINKQGSIRVTELSEMFKVTEETIRRDLEKLEKEGKLRRSHGGAVSIKKDSGIEIPYTEREIRNVKEKKRVAQNALSIIEAEDRIMLDASSTAWYLAKMIPDLPLTVVTNSIKVATELASREKITVIVTGGMLLAKSLSFVGPLALEAIDSYRVNKAFISCKGIHRSRGISDTNEMQAQVKKKMIKVADEVYLLADHTKFGVQAFSKIAPLEAVHCIISNTGVEEEQLQELKEIGINIKIE